MTNQNKLHLFDLTFEEIDALSHDDLKDYVVRTLTKYDLHKGALQDIAKAIWKDLNYMRAAR